MIASLQDLQVKQSLGLDVRHDNKKPKRKSKEQTSKRYIPITSQSSKMLMEAYYKKSNGETRTEKLHQHSEQQNKGPVDRSDPASFSFLL